MTDQKNVYSGLMASIQEFGNIMWGSICYDLYNS